MTAKPVPIDERRPARDVIDQVLGNADVNTTGPSWTRAGSDGPVVNLRARLHDGGSFILDVPELPPAVWGAGAEVLWAQGEPAILTGPPGVGKTTVTGQLVRARLGLAEEVLGWPVQTSERRVLYLAMDRPQQIRRSLHRQFTEADRAALDERLVVWKGPPPADLAKHPNTLVDLAVVAGADTVIVDSLKDAALDLSKDETGSGLNRAFQEAIEKGVELLVLHHQRKGRDGTRPKTLEDLYGSAWISAGVGSVLLLWGAAGDPIVELHHLKQPAGDVGPLKVEHQLDGTTVRFRGFDPLAFLTHRPNGATAVEAAAAMTEKEKPNDNERKKAQRVLDRLVLGGLATKRGTGRGGSGGSSGARYYVVADVDEAAS